MAYDTLDITVGVGSQQVIESGEQTVTSYVGAPWGLAAQASFVIGSGQRIIVDIPTGYSLYRDWLTSAGEAGEGLPMTRGSQIWYSNVLTAGTYLYSIVVVPEGGAPVYPPPESAEESFRTTVIRVKKIIETDMDSCEVEAYIKTSSVFVEVHLESYNLDDDLMEEMERWIAAHFIAATREQQLEEGEAGTAKGIFQGKSGMGLASTQYGQQAVMLDPTGTLAKLTSDLAVAAAAKEKGLLSKSAEFFAVPGT